MLAELAYHMPVFSAILLLVAGILIGYALWLPLRGDAEGIAESLRDLSEHNDQLQTSLREQRDAYAALERSYSTQQDEWTQLRVSSQRIEQAWDQHQREHHDIGQGLHALRELKEQAAEDITRERQTRTELEATLRETTRRAHSAEAEAARAQEQMGELKLRFDQAHQAVQARDQQLAALAAASSQHTDTAIKQYERQLAELNTAVQEERRQLDDAAREKENALTQLTNERRQREALQEQLDQHAQAACHSQQQTEEQQQQLQQRVTQLQQDLAQSLDQLAESVSEREAATSDVQQAVSQLEALKHDLSCHRQTIETIQRQRDQFSADLEAAAQERDVLQQEREALQQERDVLRQECEALQESLQSAEQTASRHHAETVEESDQLREACRKLTGTLKDQEALVRTLQIERDEAHSAAADEQHKQQQFSQRLHQAQQEVDKLREQREELLASLRTEEARGEKLQAELQAGQRQARIAEERVLMLQPLEAELAGVIDQYNRATHLAHEVEQERDAAMAAVQRAQDTIIGLRSELNKHSEKISQLRRDAEELALTRAAHHDAINTVAEHEATIADLREELETQAEAIASLTREREQVLARLRRQSVMLESRLEGDGSRPRLAADTVQSSVAHLDSRRGLVYNSRPQHVDDLQKITGIAAVLEQKLNQLGVYTYKQIMEWSPAHIAEFSQLLAFPDRIERDDWIGQARCLFEEQSGEAA